MGEKVGPKNDVHACGEKVYAVFAGTSDDQSTALTGVC